MPPIPRHKLVSSVTDEARRRLLQCGDQDEIQHRERRKSSRRSDPKIINGHADTRDAPLQTAMTNYRHRASSIECSDSPRVPSPSRRQRHIVLRSGKEITVATLAPFSLFSRQRDIFLVDGMLHAGARLRPSRSQWRTICRSLRGIPRRASELSRIYSATQGNIPLGIDV